MVAFCCPCPLSLPPVCCYVCASSNNFSSSTGIVGPSLFSLYGRSCFRSTPRTEHTERITEPHGICNSFLNDDLVATAQAGTFWDTTILSHGDLPDRGSTRTVSRRTINIIASAHMRNKMNTTRTTSVSVHRGDRSTIEQRTIDILLYSCAYSKAATPPYLL